MALNPDYWTRFFQREFAPQLRGIVDVLEKRLMPAFEGIESEAEAVSQERWDSDMSAPGTGYEDPADFAEVAEQAGESHYLLLDGIRQGMVNLFAAALYHVFEQHVMFFMRKQLLHPSEDNDLRLLRLSEFEERLKTVGVDIRSFSSWPQIDELRLVANTVKHAEGKSARELQVLRPDLLEDPQVSTPGLSDLSTAFPVSLPLLGEDLYVQLADVRRYRDALLRFWHELADALRLV